MITCTVNNAEQAIEVIKAFENSEADIRVTIRQPKLYLVNRTNQETVDIMNKKIESGIKLL